MFVDVPTRHDLSLWRGECGASEKRVDGTHGGIGDDVPTVAYFKADVDTKKRTD
jgi:hypothetical protein